MSWWQIAWRAIPGFLSLACLVLAWKYHKLAQDWERMGPYLVTAREEARACRVGAVVTIVFAVFMAGLAVFNFMQ